MPATLFHSNAYPVRQSEQGLRGSQPSTRFFRSACLCTSPDQLRFLRQHKPPRPLVDWRDRATTLSDMRSTESRAAQLLAPRTSSTSSLCQTDPKIRDARFAGPTWLTDRASTRWLASCRARQSDVVQ